MEATKHFTEMTRDEQEATNAFDLRELAHYYGGWNKLREVISNLEDRDNEAAFDRQQEDYDRQSEGERSEMQYRIQRDLK